MDPMSQEAVVSFVVEAGGKVRNSELLYRFRSALHHSDPERRRQLRDLFKRHINAVAVVREEEGVKFVVLRRKLQHLLPTGSAVPVKPSVKPAPKPGEEDGGGWRECAGEGLRTGSASAAPGEEVPQPSSSPPSSPETNFSALSFSQKVGNYETKSGDTNTNSTSNSPGAPKVLPPPKAKPHMYPLRLPPDCNRYSSGQSRQQQPPRQGTRKTVQNDTQSTEVSPDPSGDGDDDLQVPQMKRSQPAEAAGNSPQLKRSSRLPKASEDLRLSDQVPLDPVEHEWLVKTALGQWTHVCGLLLKDVNLAEKRDFMSGFTAIHWAAKSGNSEMVCWIIETAEKKGAKVDINAKAYGGYTPLHIAAIHGKEDVILKLVQDYRANTNLRDYSGKRPYHYLNKGNSLAVKQLLGDPDAFIPEAVPLHKRSSKVAHSILSSTNTFLGALTDDINFQDISKSLKKPANLSKFFAAPSMYKKRPKLRGNFTSLNEEPEEDGVDEVAMRRRPVTEIFL
eukprot:gi/632948654/ref/XP_007889713.1/ PREDICTED: ankyrin repeat domain-containing protein SOWAHA [Callorhinchus milii]